MWIAISVVLLLLCVALFMYLSALKREIRNCREELEKTREMSYNRQLTISLFDKDLTDLASGMNENLDYQKEMKLRIMKEEEKWKQSVSDIAHDLRTPLTVVKGNLQMLQQEGNLTQRQQSYLETGLQKTESLKQMMDEFFELAMLESDTNKVICSKLDITALLIQFVVDHEAVIKNCNLHPVMHIPDKSIVIDGNEDLILRMLGNLLTNVLRYAKESFEISLVEIDKDSRICELSFANALMPGQVVDETRLFDRTYRGEEARSNQGTGLGLYIVKVLAMKQGAEVFARKEESRLRIGIRFKKEI
nr:sensor histidine kinase [Lachnospiraceae bacterium]